MFTRNDTSDLFFFFSSRKRHTSLQGDWSSDVCSSDLVRHDGGIYVTHPGWNGSDPSQVWYISPKGEKKVVDKGLRFSNGLTMSRSEERRVGKECRSWLWP